MPTQILANDITFQLEKALIGMIPETYSVFKLTEVFENNILYGVENIYAI